MPFAPVPSPAVVDQYLEGSPFAARLAARLEQRNTAHWSAVVYNRCHAHGVPCRIRGEGLVLTECGTFIRTDGYYPAEVVAVQLAIALGY